MDNHSLEVKFQFLEWIFLKFIIYSEKATKILRNLPLTFDHSTYSQKKWKILQNFVAFSEYMNFNEKFI